MDRYTSNDSGHVKLDGEDLSHKEVRNRLNGYEALTRSYQGCESDLKAILGDARYVFYLEFDGNEFVLLEKHDVPISTHEYARGANLKELIENYKARENGN